MGSRTQGIGEFERLEALFRDEAIYTLAELIPHPPPEHGGAPRMYPDFMVIAWLAMQAIFTSCRHTEAVIAQGPVWAFMQRAVRDRFPADPDQWLRDEPMKRHHFLYARRCIIEASGQAELVYEFERQAATLAGELGLCDPNGTGSLSHPSLERTMYGDGKVITPLFKAKRGELRTDGQTGEIRVPRSDPDATGHTIGSGEEVYGNKFVMIGARTRDVHGRVILGIDHVPTRGGEAGVALDVFRRITPRLPGAQAVLYDGAFRGVHLQALMRDLGLLPVVPVHAKAGGRRARKPRVERTIRVGHAPARRRDGTVVTNQLYAEGGALCIGELDENGDVVLTPLRRRKVLRRLNRDGSWRWYADYDVPMRSGGGDIRVRLDTTDDDVRVGLNRTEHVRAFPPHDPEYKRLYSRRADAESWNRGLDDTNYLRRAHSVGAQRQLLDVLGFAISVNALARARLQRLRHIAA